MIRELVQAHGFVAALAFLLDRLLEKKLKAAKLPFSPEEALTHLRTVQRRPRQTSLAPNTAESRRETNTHAESFLPSELAA
ncbi:hypothetical protein A7Q09_01470 [Methylacidiphilum sp. Yel]|nr:hypothetical protein A7Q09_01470 [Methylacidiphilum sp. Yel]